MADASENSWHSLFDALCNEKGFFENGELAAALCERRKNGAPGAYESALKSVSNWREGRHTPNRRNFRLLTLILELDEHPTRADEWRALYELALRKKAADIEEVSETSSLAESKAVFSYQPVKTIKRYAGLAAGIAVIALAVLVLNDPPAMSSGGSGGATVLPLDMTDQQIYYRQQVKLKVGESIVVHGKRGESCGKAPPEWPNVLKFLPEVSTGVWTDGGVGFRVSRACGGPTPARAVVFTATRPGMDKFMLYDDPITITVE